MEKHGNHFRPWAYQLYTTSICRDFCRIRNFNCLGFVATAADRPSFKDNKWLAVTLAEKARCCPGTVITDPSQEEPGIYEVSQFTATGEGSSRALLERCPAQSSSIIAPSARPLFPSAENYHRRLIPAIRRLPRNHMLAYNWKIKSR